VAAERALLTSMGVLDDPLAKAMLTPSMAAMLTMVQHMPHRFQARSVTLAGLAARVLWFDEQVAGALQSHISQIAVIGAGYDSRAWRFRREGVQFFELDHGATQQDKARRAPGPGPLYVEVDLENQGAGEALFAQGFDPSLPVQFVMEGVTMYLDQEVVRRQLADLAQRSAPGSRIALDFLPPRDAGTSRNHRQNRIQRLARSGSGEAFKTTLGRAEAAHLVVASGWEVTVAVSLREVARALVPPESALPVNAVNEHKSLIAALRS
jgi:methyltransferase (TIGR00027 family)